MTPCKFLNQEFCHLHLHTEYSPQDAPVGLKDLVEYARHLGYKSLAVSDHGNIGSWVKFQTLCKKNDMKPIFGVEAYFTPDRHVRKSRKDNYHQLLLAKSNTGIKNIYRMTELAFTDGFYYDPRIDWDLLEKYHEGVICTSACVSGIVAETFEREGREEAKKVAERFRSIFGDDYYLEVQCHGIDVEDVYVGVADIAKETGIKIVGTNDVHYLRQEDHKHQEDMMALNMRRCVRDPNKLKHEMNQFYLKSPDEMVSIFGGKDCQAVVSTVEIMDKCNAEIETGRTQIPAMDIPKGMTDFEFLESKVWDGLAKKGLDKKEEYRERAESELALVRKLREEKGLRFDRYFLVVADYVRWAWDNGIRVGIGRGSGAGSLMLYSLDITGIDPLKYDLLFERFLAEDRIQMPDIDIDFDSEHGYKMFDYLTEKYGRDKWARIGTVGRYLAASAIKAAYRVYDPGGMFEIRQQEKEAAKARKKDKAKHRRQANIEKTKDKTVQMANETTKLLPRANPRDKSPDPACTLKMSVKKNDEDRRYVYDEVAELRNLKAQYPELFEFAEHLEGLVSNRGTHAAGVLITETPTIEFAPQQYSGRKEEVSTAFDMDDIELIGGLKFDFLQTNVLSVLTRTKQAIKARYNVEVPIDDIDFDVEDPEVLKLFAQGDTDGIFQFEGEGMKRVLKQMAPSCFEEVIAANALYRPGPMDNIDDFCSRKRDPNRVYYVAPELEQTLKPTFGIMVYQEQVMKAVRILAGFTASESDKVRKAMGKKKKELLDEMKAKFIAGCDNVGYVSASSAEQIWTEMERFASYAFNKSHSAGYGYTAYQCAWLKRYYPAEFMAAQMTVEGGCGSQAGMEACQKYEKTVKRMGIPLLPLDINKSKGDYLVEDQSNGSLAIRRGFKGIKGVGNAYEDIEAGQPYRDMYDFCDRAGSGTKSNVVKMLIDEKAFDWLLPKLSQRKIDGKRADRDDLLKEYNQMMKRARAEHNVKGARKEEKEGISQVFMAGGPDEDDGFSLSLEDF